MYKAVNGVFENGQVFLEEVPPVKSKTKVVVMFMEEQTTSLSFSKGIKMGSLANMGFSIPDDFNAPLDDLKEYE